MASRFHGTLSFPDETSVPPAAVAAAMDSEMAVHRAVMTSRLRACSPPTHTHTHTSIQGDARRQRGEESKERKKPTSNIITVIK